jgi:hypothetical protein
MTLQEKIDKLPYFIIYQNVCFELEILFKKEVVWVQYCVNDNWLFAIENRNQAISKTQRLEDVVARALKVIESKEWEK